MSFFRNSFSTGTFPFKDNVCLLLLRVCAGGAMLLFHGLPKWGKSLDSLPNPLDINGMMNGAMIIFAEVICAAFMVLGLATRLAALVLSICMSVAFFVFHNGDPFEKGEKAFLYLVMYVSILIMGSGQFALDRFIGKK